jgi:DNA-binding response OmpR family regulator
MKKILVVEDDKDIQQVFKIVLHSLGYRVECLEDGAGVLQITHWPDAIILDKQLPGMNGVDVCKALKSMEESQHVPVIMISGTSGVEEAARLAGADDYLEKPFQMHVILKKLTKLLAPKRETVNPSY